VRDAWAKVCKSPVSYTKKKPLKKKKGNLGGSSSRNGWGQVTTPRVTSLAVGGIGEGGHECAGWVGWEQKNEKSLRMKPREKVQSGGGVLVRCKWGVLPNPTAAEIVSRESPSK